MNPVPPVFVLSIDGGGVRALFAVYLLRLIGHRIFDLYTGMSMGGFISTALSMGKSADYLINNIFTLCNVRKVCDKSLFDRIFGVYQFDSKYDGRGKETVIRETLFEEEVKSNLLLFSYNLSKGKQEVYFRKGSEEDQVLERQDQVPNTPYDLTPCTPLSFYDTLISGTSVPIYFPPSLINGNLYIDAGVSTSNPGVLAYLEAKRLFPNREIRLLSIGTGPTFKSNPEDNKPEVWTNIKWIKKSLFDLFLSASINYQEDIIEKIKDIDPKFKYLRLNYRDNKIEIDDTEDDILIRLESIAKQIYSENKDKICEMFEK